MNFIKDKERFNTELNKVNSFLYFDNKFPNQIFKDIYSRYLFFDFDIIYTKEFINSIIKLMNTTNDKKVNILILNPDPIDYYYKYFKKYPFSSFENHQNSEDYITFLNSEPQRESPDSLIYNSNLLILYPDSLKWSIIGNREFEIAVIAFNKNQLSMSLPDLLTELNLLTIDEALEELISVLYVNNEFSIPNDIRIEFIKNYSNR